MTHVVHPKVYRIREAKDWLSQGFYGKKQKKYLEVDLIIREFLKDKLKDCGVEKIEIERSPREGKTNVAIYSSRPGFIIGRRGEGIESLKSQLIKEIAKKERLDLTKKETKDKFKKLNLEVKEVADPWASANLVAQWVAQRLEKRLPYRRVLKQGLSKIMSNRSIKGAKIQVSGRLSGVTIARTEWLKNGELPRQTIRADIDYGFSEAHCTYGIIGVKVWIYKGEKF